jgi:hypothetical protein
MFWLFFPAQTAALQVNVLRVIYTKRQIFVSCDTATQIGLLLIWSLSAAWCRSLPRDVERRENLCSCKQTLNHDTDPSSAPPASSVWRRRRSAPPAAATCTMSATWAWRSWRGNRDPFFLTRLKGRHLIQREFLMKLTKKSTWKKRTKIALGVKLTSGVTTLGSILVPLCICGAWLCLSWLLIIPLNLVPKGKILHLYPILRSWVTAPAL